MLNPMPLSIHLTMLLTSSLCSVKALHALKEGLPIWSPPFEKKARKLRKSLFVHDFHHLRDELHRQIYQQFSDIMRSVEMLSAVPKPLRDLPTAPVIWEQGSSRVYDFSRLFYSSPPSHNPVILFVPSLINRSYILDLSEKQSLMRYLARQNVNPFLLEWDDPHMDELHFTLEDYITKRLLPAIYHLRCYYKRPIMLAGYCMGGMMVLAAALLNIQQELIKGCAFLATPWDFHTADFARIRLDTTTVKFICRFIQKIHRVPASVVQSMFYYLHPELVTQKLRHFMHSNLQDQIELMTLEHWVNDGMSMTKHIWKECFIHWVHDNHPATRQWRICHAPVMPSAMTLPALCVIPQKDRIVPHSCAIPLFNALPHAQLLQPDAGHVGMIIGTHAEKQLWEPLTHWIHQLDKAC